MCTPRHRRILLTIFGMVLVVTAAGCQPAGASPTGTGEGIAPLVTADDALAVAAQWGEWLGVQADHLRVALRDRGLTAFDRYCELASDDQRYVIEVNAYKPYVSHWGDLEHQPREPRAARTKREVSLLNGLARSFIRDHVASLPLDRMQAVGSANAPVWLELVDGNVAFASNAARVRVDFETSRVYEAYIWASEVSADTTPALSPHECVHSALRLLHQLPGLTVVDEDPPLGDTWNWLKAYYHLEEDAAGAQRLTRLVHLLISREDGAEQGPWLIKAHVDAHSGECFRVEGLAEDPASCEMRLNGREFFKPVFPCRVLRGVPYVYVGYLESLIWRGEVEATEASATTRYADTTWAVTAASGSVDVDGQQRAFTQQPRTIAGYLYLPPEIIKAITGWEVEYVEAANTVYIYSHLQGEEPEAADE